MSAVPGGWYRDPTGRHELRYWDAARWTSYVADQGRQSNDSIVGDYAAPIAAESASAPRRGVRGRGPGRWSWAFSGCVVAIAVLVIGCAGVIIVAVNDAKHELTAQERRHAISQAQFDAIPLGISEAEVRSRLGKEPQNTQEFLQKDALDADAVKRSCIYYNRKGGQFGDTFQFCFRQSQLISKGTL